MRIPTLSLSLAFALSVFLLLLAGCTSIDKTTLNGHKIYDEEEVDQPPTPVSASPPFRFSYTTELPNVGLRDATVGFVVNRSVHDKK